MNNKEILTILLDRFCQSKKKSHRILIREIINSVTSYYMKSLCDWNCRQNWLARKYATLWRLKTIERLKTYKPFNLIDYTTWVRVVDVYDGDTMKVIMNYRGNIDQWTVRMNGYDSPEIKPAKSNPNREKEKAAAIIARQALIDKTRQPVFLKIVGFDKYGRLLAEAYLGKTHLNRWMIDNGHGYPYDGGKKKEFI